MANRPASRGMGGPPPPTGGMRPGPVAAKGGFGVPSSAAVPSNFAPVGMRPPTNAGGRPGSSAGVPQGMRPPTSGGMGGGNGNNGGSNVPLQTDVNVVVRPMTGMASGVSGMPTKSLGPGRVIADKTYYLTDLNKKLNDILRELDAMRFEMERMGSDNQLYAQLERKYEVHMKEVRVLEGQLADFNLAFDKLRTNTNIQEIQEMYAHLKERNEREKRSVDEIFLKAQHQEKQTREIEERIAGLHAAAASRIASLGEEKQAEYLELQEELVGVNDRITEREGVLAGLEREISGYEETMKSESYHLLQQGQQLSKENAALARQKQELEDELAAALSPAEVKEKLTQKIKDATQETSDLEKTIKRLEVQIEKLTDNLRNKETEMGDAKKHSMKAKKYEAIYERDGKMSEFLKDFPQLKNLEIENKKKMKEIVVALLKHLSKELNAAATLSGEGGEGSTGTKGPDAGQYTELKDEVSFKDQKLADSEKTLVALQGDLAKRREELEKIESLDAKIGAEINQLQDKIAAMQAEMRSFKSEDDLKDAAVIAKRALLVENATHKKAREAIKIQVAALSADFEKKNKELQSSEAFKRIENWETKLKTHAGAVFTLQEFITTKKRESDYEGLLKECSEVTKQINTILIQQQK